jgi:predicted transposase YdaD
VPSLLPFVPILKGGAEETTIQQALQILRADEQLNQLETVLAFFASFVLDSGLVQQIMRWDMAVLQESPWYQQIVRESEERGRRQQLLSSIEMGLQAKFGSEGLQLMTEICQITQLERLNTILLAIITVNTLDELRQLI